ncbi:MAG: TonB-dependent receptor plug domain-containing protein [Paludibacter sp.]|nr:TonB-dependent receptor plug domain-containing protein [Paludibacter sp.]
MSFGLFRCFIAKRNKLILFLIFFSSLIFGEEKLDTAKVYSIREFTVTEQFRSSEVRSSAPLQILSSKKIEQLNVLQVSDAVKYFSGVSVKDYGGIGGLKTVAVRSLGAAHTALSYDGVPVSDVQTGQIDIGRFSLENVDMLSLNNGQSDNIFQPARLFASASVLNIRTLSPAFEAGKAAKGKISLKAGSFGLINPSFLLQNKINSTFSSSLSGEWLSANGRYPYLLEYSYLGDGITSKEIRRNTDVQNLRLEGALYANFPSSASGYVKAYYYQSHRGLPGATILYNENAFSSQRLSDMTFFTQAHFEKDFSKRLSMQLNAKFNHGNVHYTDTAYLNDAGKMESMYRQQEYYGSFALLYRAFQHLSFSFSTDGIANRMTADFETDALNNAFAQPTRYQLLSVVAAKYVTNHLLATASMLGTLVNEDVKVGHSGRNQRRLSPYLSVNYQPFEYYDLRFRVFYKNIFRLPTFNDLYYSRVGNADLRPEVTDQLNFGVTYTVGFGKWMPLLSVTMDGYRNYVKDKIVALPTKNIFIWSMLNVGKVQVDGLDITAETSILPWKDTGFVLGVTYTYQQAIDVTTPDGNTYGHQVPYTPRVSGSGKIGVETRWVNLSYAVLWSGHRYGGYQNYVENRLPGYADHSIALSRDFSIEKKKISVNMEMLNLLDKNYAIVKWFPMPGRSFRATLAMKF